MSGGGLVSLRVIPELRAAHVERQLEWHPEEPVLYRRLNWDLVGTAVPSSCRPLTWASLMRHALWSRPGLVELPEPLWLRELPTSLFVAATFWAASGGRTRRVCYCIENAPAVDLFGGHGTLAKLGGGVIGMLIRGLVTKMCFGSEGSRQLYQSLPGVREVESKLVPELPCPAGISTTAEADGVLFVGRLEHRKGVEYLMRAWSAVEQESQASLTIVGDGELRAEVASWCAEEPLRRKWLGQISHADMPQVYAAHRVLVAPSVVDGRWREQIGLPIKEGLSYGLTVVTTVDTGLAGWLAAGGHMVGEVADLEGLLARAIRSPLDPDDVRGALPATDGRLQADRWLRA